jgi:hypothetical protein
MPGELINMSSQFKGLPMGDLIGGPLNAACDAQLRLAHATEEFIKSVGFLPATKDNPQLVPRTVRFEFERPAQLSATEGGKPGGSADAPTGIETVKIEVPLLAIVKVPNLSIEKVDITFDMEVKSSTSDAESSDQQATLDAEAKVGWGMFSATVKIHGSVSAHQEHTRTSDNSAKYHVEVHAADRGIPEGLARVLDILQTAAAPKSITRKALAA